MTMSSDNMKVITDLEKKTKDKILKMTDDSSTMDFVLKNLKLIKRIKRCRVRLVKGSGNNESKRRPGPGKSRTKRIGDLKKTDRKQKRNAATGVSTRKKPQASSGEDTNTKLKKRKSTETSTTATITSSKGPANKLKKKDSSPATNSASKSKKTDANPKGKDGGKQLKKKRQIFIELPFLERARMRCLGKILPNMIREKKGDKKKPVIKRLGRTYLTEKFGSKFFRCHVKVLRYIDPNNPMPRKKDKSNRKSVSFVETVEIFGESDDDISGSPVVEIVEENTSVISVNSDDSASNSSGSPKRRKLSSLKGSDIPRSERMKKSDEKIPRVPSEEDIAIVESIEPIEESDEVVVPDEIAEVPEEVNDENTSSNKEKVSEIMTSDEDEDEDHVEPEKTTNSIFKSNSNSGEISEEEEHEKEETQNESKSSEDDEECVESLAEVNAADSRSTENHINSSLNETPPQNIASPIDDDMFADAEDHFEEESVRGLQLSCSPDKTTTTTTATTNNDSEERNPETPNSQLDNDKSDNTDDTTRPQQTKFSLNTFFKSLTTKRIPETQQTASPNKGTQQLERDDDNALRSELTIK